MYFEGPRVSFSEDRFFVLTNSVDADEMTHHAAFHSGIHCFPMYACWGHQRVR